MTERMTALLRRASDGDRTAESALVEENSGLIHTIARRYYGRGLEPEDLYQLACVGFIKAVRGFDPALGNEFSTYAVPKIAGEIRRFLRDDGAVKVSRAVKERAMRVRRIQSELESRLGRSPGVTELAAAAGLTPKKSPPASKPRFRWTRWNVSFRAAADSATSSATRGWRSVPACIFRLKKRWKRSPNANGRSLRSDTPAT